MVYWQVAGGDKTKCDKCGKIRNGRRSRPDRHKMEHHSY
jgi:hypothetical protein